MKTVAIFLLVSSSLYGCMDVGQEPAPDLSPPVFNATFASIEIEDSEILRVTYSSFKIPQEFYQEDLQGGSPYYESSLSIIPLNLRQPPFFELSTNDRQQALAWSESSSVNSVYYRELTDERETDRYFEFRRVYQQNPHDIILSYELPRASTVTLFVYNVIGQQVATLVDEKQRAGYHEVVFRPDRLASGVYLYRLRAGEFTETRKMLILQ